jgi:hypothetical protein
MPKYAVIKPSVQIYFSPWTVVSEDSRYVTKNKALRMFVWQKSEDGPKFLAIIDRKPHRSGHTQWVSILDAAQKEKNKKLYHFNGESLSKVQKFIFKQIKENNPEILYKNPRKDIVWEGYKWK